MNNKRLEALSELSKLDQELGFYDDNIDSTEKYNCNLKLEQNEQDIESSRPKDASQDSETPKDGL